MFIDRAEIKVRGGNGGNGSASFRREKFVAKGGPDGGDGGKGGDVYLRANPRFRTLLDFVRKSKYEATRGGNGSGRKKFGKNGEDLILDVPCGTVVYREKKLVADLLLPNSVFLAAKGGRGGRGNLHFKNSVRQAPHIAELGEPAEEARLVLELKLIADVGLIGCPNAGKSTLLSRLTRAHPKIADYPFTTLHPNLGVSVVNDREIIFADIPGLIEGSHTGRGLGIEFLRHIERTRALVHVVDPLGYGNKTAPENILAIEEELRKYSGELLKKPQIIVVNKQDLTGAEKIFREIKKSFKKMTVLAASGVTGEGIPELMLEVGKIIAKLPEEEPLREPQTPVHIHIEPDFWIEKVDDKFIVRGKKVETLVSMTNFNLPEAVERTQFILRKMGVEKSLARGGAKDGDLVQIGNTEFLFQPEIEIGSFEARRARRNAVRPR